MSDSDKKPKTPAQRQSLRRKRLNAEGFTQRNVWVHKLDQERYDAFIETLRKPDDHASGTGHQQ